jgi:hypothetical protein
MPDTFIPPPAFYDVHRKTFWIENERGEWIELTERSFERRLSGLGACRTRTKGRASHLDNVICHYQRKYDVDYAGPLAGCPKGVREILGKRILVTSSPRLIVPKPGEWPTVRTVIENLLGTEQLPYVYGWLKCALDAVRSGRYRPGQALAIAGSADCGKSLLQSLITEILGGRAAKPYGYMSGRTPFNSDLFEAEHLVIEDDVASTDIRARRIFGANIKSVTVNRDQWCHKKGQPPIMLTPCWRLSITVNEEPENLMIFPPIDDSIVDKITLLKANKCPMPMPTETLEEREAFWAKLVSELAAFLHFLSEWQIPEALRSSRFGVVHYHHPELLAAINELAPEEQLLSLIDSMLFQSSSVWQGDAETLTTALCVSTGYFDFGTAQSRRLLNWPNAAGVYLGRLAKRYPQRVECRRTAKQRLWRITKDAGGSQQGSSGGSQ